MKTKPIKEAEFQKQIIQLGHLFGWRIAHFRPALTKRGWRTAVSGDGAGFPDLVLARDGFTIFAELKTDTGVVSIEQWAWLESLGGIHKNSHTIVAVWRPRDFAEIENILRTIGK